MLIYCRGVCRAKLHLQNSLKQLKSQNRLKTSKFSFSLSHNNMQNYVTEIKSLFGQIQKKKIELNRHILINLLIEHQDLNFRRLNRVTEHKMWKKNSFSMNKWKQMEVPTCLLDVYTGEWSRSCLSTDCRTPPHWGLALSYQRVYGLHYILYPAKTQINRHLMVGDFSQ